MLPFTFLLFGDGAWEQGYTRSGYSNCNSSQEIQDQLCHYHCLRKREPFDEIMTIESIKVFQMEQVQVGIDAQVQQGLCQLLKCDQAGSGCNQEGSNPFCSSGK